MSREQQGSKAFVLLCRADEDYIGKQPAFDLLVDTLQGTI